MNVQPGSIVEGGPAETQRPVKENGNWDSLGLDVKEIIFRIFRNQNNLTPKQLLKIRLVNRETDFLIRHIIVSSRVFKAIGPVDPTQEYLSQFGMNSASIYAASESKELLNYFLHDHDSNRVFETEGETHLDAADYLEILKSSYHYPCLRFRVYCLELLDQYRQYLESQGLAFKPQMLECHLEFVQELGGNEFESIEDESVNIAYYEKLSPLLTEDLKRLYISIDPWMVRILMSPDIARVLINPETTWEEQHSEAELIEMKSNDMKVDEVELAVNHFQCFEELWATEFPEARSKVDHFRHVLKSNNTKAVKKALEEALFLAISLQLKKKNPTETELNQARSAADFFRNLLKEKENSKLNRLLFGKKLDQLTCLEIDGDPDDNSWKLRLSEIDMDSLEKLTPNLRELALNHFTIDLSFIIKLFEGSLITNIENLNFYGSLVTDKICLTQLSGSSQLSNLKSLVFPYFHQKGSWEHDPQYDSQLSSFFGFLQTNTCLGNLETIALSDEKVHLKTAFRLLVAIATNKSLTKLKTIKGLNIGEMRFPEPFLLFLQKNYPESFDFSCIKHLFLKLKKIKGEPFKRELSPPKGEEEEEEREIKHEGTPFPELPPAYVGDLQDGMAHGKGKLIYADGEAYEGDFQDGEFHGKGKYTCANGNTYEGDWQSGMKHGSGMQTFPDGSAYEVEYINDKPVKILSSNTDAIASEEQLIEVRGEGKFIFANGDCYEGDFQDGKFHGKGKYTWANGLTYVGDFQDFELHGKGKCTWANGNTYEGDFQYGMMHGFGTQTFPEGRTYEVEYVNNELVKSLPSNTETIALEEQFLSIFRRIIKFGDKGKKSEKSEEAESKGQKTSRSETREEEEKADGNPSMKRSRPEQETRKSQKTPCAFVEEDEETSLLQKRSRNE